ncbi:MAG TPA: SMP-30/gluconolactonase/LRE family protein [Gemmatimonadaceae bacterium]
MRSNHVVIALSAIALLACTKDKPADTSAAPAGGTKLGETVGMKVPESVRYDPELDVFYVSNINGNPSQKDNNGFIAKVRADSPSVVTMLAEGGKNGVTLNAPKGIAIHGDTLFVTDIDALRMFDRKTGKSLGDITVSPKATFLNDVVVGPDGIYFTDSGIFFDAKGAMTHPGVDRIYKLAAGKLTVVASDSLASPNGITWDAAGKRFLLAPFGGPNMQSWAPGEKYPTTVAMGPGGYDGIELLANGTVLISSWADSTVNYMPPGHPMIMPLVRNVSAPADIGVDTKRNVLAIPRFNDGKVDYYKLP